MLCWTARASDVLIRPARYFMAMRTFEIARVLVRFDHVARFIVNADHSAM